MKSLGVAIGSGGVYSAAGLGLIKRLEEEGIRINHVGGASGGAIIAALYYLCGNAIYAQKHLLTKISKLQSIKFNPFKKPVSGNDVKSIIADILDNRDWKDGKGKKACFGVSVLGTKKSLVLTSNTGLSLVDCVLASTSFKMIKPSIKLKGQYLVHGGDPHYIKGLHDLGAALVIEVSPNLEKGLIGKIAKISNTISKLVILKKDYVFNDRMRSVADIKIQPNLRLFPLITPLNFEIKNVEYMINEGWKLTEEMMPIIKKKLS
jgi:predicted acylesterase/phospholipase RssA